MCEKSSFDSCPLPRLLAAVGRKPKFSQSKLCGCHSALRRSDGWHTPRHNGTGKRATNSAPHQPERHLCAADQPNWHQLVDQLTDAGLESESHRQRLPILHQPNRTTQSQSETPIRWGRTTLATSSDLGTVLKVPNDTRRRPCLRRFPLVLTLRA